MIDDKIGDIELARGALAYSGIRHDLKLVHDGASLLFAGGDDAAPMFLPDLIVISLELPGADMLEIYREIRARGWMAAVPVVLLTTSGREEDVRNTHAAAGNTYVRRPEDLGRAIIEVLGDHWDIFALLSPAA